MAFHKVFGGAGVALCMMTAPAAWADVSSAQVWEDFKAYMQGFGYSMTATEAQGAGALVVSDITLNMALPDDDGTITFGLPNMTFTDSGDGSVVVTLPAQSQMPFSVDVPDDEDASGAISLSQTGFLMTVSGNPGDLTYDYSAADLTVALAELTVEGEAVEIAAASTTLRNLDGQSTVTVGDLREVVQRMTAGVVEYTIDMTDPEDGEGRIQFDGAANNLGFEGSMSLPLEAIAPDDANAMLEAGFAVRGGYTHQGGQTNFTIDDDGSVVSGTTSSASGRFDVRMDSEQLGYTVGAQAVALNVTTSDLPFPVEMQMAETAVNFQLPVTPGDEPQDFALALTLGDFTMSDMIWGMFDPAGQLPRDPATIKLDLGGTAKLDAPLMDPEAMESAETPGELRSVDIREVLLRIAGAQLTGQGGFTFDNSDTGTFGGMPRPEGSVDLRLEGGNTLLDTLVNMGFVPQEQATGVRMMMGLFAVPGDGDDVLTSTIEINEQGHVLANGQRLR